MEEDAPPPPVPPKDERYRANMDDSRPPSASASGSKRKRDTKDDSVYELRNGRLEAGDMEHTPKRSRSHAAASDGNLSADETPIATRSIRRKKGLRNLSNISLRQAALASNVPRQQTSPVRESKFQEGSLSDKPSEQPPSVFTRLARTDSGNLEQIEVLMTDYHDGIPSPVDSTKAILAYEAATRDQRVADIIARQKKDEGSGVFRFGKSLAAAFRPVALWNRIWSEQKEELARKDLEDAARKAKLKEAAEARYAQMKGSGQFGLQPVAFQTPHDSAVLLNGAPFTGDHHRTASVSSERESYGEALNHEEDEVPDTVSKHPLRSIRSRLHLRRPSLQDIKSGLQRVKSDFHLGSNADRSADWDYSSSASPTKGESNSLTLQRSTSRIDLKKQNRLTKRVSDLEMKLQKARDELDEALTLASPMPNLGSNHERFAPFGTVRRPKFVPLPTLPSEGVLFPRELGFRGDDKGHHRLSRPRKTLDLNKAFENDDEEEDEEEGTIRPSREKPYPPHASEIFPEAEEIQQLAATPSIEEDTAATAAEPTSELTGLSETGYGDNTGPASEEVQNGGRTVVETRKAKLGDLEASFKASKIPRSKKRAMRDDGQREYQPTAESHDDSESEEAKQKPKKKRRSTGKAQIIPPGKPKSPSNKVVDKAYTATPKTAKAANLVKDIAMAMANADGSEDELQRSQRGSMVSHDGSLAAVYEEEEESFSVPLKDEPSKPTAKATPARFGRPSTSPYKQAGAGLSRSDEGMLTRAAETAQRRRSTRATGLGTNKDDIKHAEDADLPIAVTPGQGSVPDLPKGAGGKGNNRTSKENFEWPADVF